MYLSQTAEYALRAMSCIVLKKDQRPVSSKVLARAAGIPGHYLSKIMRKMVEGGLVVSQKGHGGGFRLARPPEEISFEMILETVDYKIEPDSCVFGWDECDNNQPCPLHHTWSQLKESYQWWAKNMTLQDVAERPEEIQKLLNPDDGS
ncbi:MAG: Rrf2 family transcriptional regulator [Balneolaceae bacterium]|nr:Rrf2 family transcriptional regulator [Balneolaceae bacterium]